MEKFFYSPVYLFICAAVALYGIYAEKEIIPVFVIIFLGCINVLTCRDILPTLAAVIIVPMMTYTRYADYEYYFRAFLLFALLIPCYLVHLTVFRPKLKPSRFVFTTALVAVAVTLGGLFVATKEELLNFAAIYHIFALGIGMLVIQLGGEAGIPSGKKETADFFARLMTTAGIVGVGMIIIYYYRNYALIETRFNYFMSQLYWGNDLSTTLLLTMPFTFYLAAKKNIVLSPLYTILGLLQGAALLLSLSRGGILFGSVLTVLCIAAAIGAGKGKRIFIAATVAAAGVLAYFAIDKYLLPIIREMAPNLKANSDETRVHLYRLAWDVFKEYPIFGRGLGHNPEQYFTPNEKGIYWYHSTLFQILASLGIVGLIAYAAQAMVRLYTLFSVKNKFNLFTLLSMLGFAAYSMVNVGYFMPFPFVVIVTIMFIVTLRSNQNHTAMKIPKR